MYSSFLSSLLSTNNHDPLLRERVRRNLQVQRRRPLPSSSRHIVMATMARAEPSSEVAGLADRHAAQVGANAYHDQPLWPLHAVFVSLWVAEDRDAGSC